MDNADGSEDVNDFLQRIKELGDKRDKEDEERNRKLEEEILQGRRERQARRAERARSISPTKDSPSNAATPQSLRSAVDTPTHDRLARSKPTLQPTPNAMSRETVVNDTLDHLTGPAVTDGNAQSESEPTRVLPEVPRKPEISSRSSPSAAVPPSRAGTLSWQRRPNSQGLSSPRSRPLSAVTTQNRSELSPRATPEPLLADDGEIPKSQITQSLSSKDPSWFKQTADRGLGSAAFRRNQNHTGPDSGDMGSKMPLPGLSREPTAEPENLRSPPPESVRSTSPSRASSFRDSASGSVRYSSTSSVSRSGNLEARSPLPTMSSQRFEPPTSDINSSTGGEQHNLACAPAMSPSQGRISPERMERPSSPTKGLGGFVQSAMLKRSDSVTKRWSTQATPGLSRGNSIASNRNGYGGSREGLASLAGSMKPPKLDSRPESLSRETSPKPNSRPTSSHSNITITQGRKEHERPSTSESGRSVTGSPLNGGFSRPIDSQATREPSTGHAMMQNSPPKDRHGTSPPTSPSKTMDPKRWSPTKASWLESALNKPDSPKPKAPPPQQPSWMVDINKAKQQRGDVERPGSHTLISTGGLMRPPPPGGSERPLDSRIISNGLSSNTHGEGRVGNLSGPEGAEETTSSLTRPKPMNEFPEAPKSTSQDVAMLDIPVMSKEPSGNSSKSPASSTVSPSQTNSMLTKQGRSSPVVGKPKPDTPPKKDFRAGLKPRQQSADTGPKSEPEFKNVFGKLKRTQTQNYVAPDVLKSNILRGKAGLSVTDGPQKTERQDELKQSLIKQKEAIKAKASKEGPPGLASSSSGGRDPPTSPSAPEAIAKKNTVARSDSASSRPIQLTDSSSITSEADARHRSLKDKPKISPPAKQRISQENDQTLPATSGKLNDRLNPALAGLLARKTSPAPTSHHQDHESVSGPPVSRALSRVRPNPEEFSAHTAPQLTHMTKARARGPRRRLPNAADNSQDDSEPAADGSSLMQNEAAKATFERPVSGPLADLENNNDKAPPTLRPNPPAKKTDVADALVKSAVEGPVPHRGKPMPPIKSPVLSQKLNAAKKQEDLSSPAQRQQERRKLPPTPRKLTPSAHSSQDSESQRNRSDQQPIPLPTPSDSTQPEDEDEDEDEPTVSVKDAAALWGRSSGAHSLGSSQSRLPVTVPTRRDEEAAENRASLQVSNMEKPIGLGLQAATSNLSSEEPLDKNLPSPKSPPIPPKNAQRLSSKSFPATHNKPNESPIPQTSEAFRLFEEFFDEVPKATGKVNIDTQAVLSSNAGDVSKIKTLRKQIWEVTGDGKRTAVPSHQEHILFEDNMYLCTHIFGASNGVRTTETYLWVGCNVPDSAVEDTQLFSRKVAKENNCKLALLKQGRETANFFQALGGIVITRCGSRSRVDSPYMLCGRRYAGQIAFDEVELSPSRLCSGFPYIVSSLAGKLFLWKGKGSSADELGCARLIGMDLGLSGEIEEIDEGHEPQQFLDIFPLGTDKSIPSSADYWRLKAKYDTTYRARTFSVEHETASRLSSLWSRRPSTPNSSSGVHIREIAPFCQTDLARENIYVVDAFFEVYIVVGAHAQSKFGEFQSALVFAQEYGILAASMEDRPFVPVGTVVLEDVPRDLKVVFRKWDDKCTMTKSHLEGGPSPKVVPLSAAIAATRG
ncbi:MAG: hypothetical protein M1812_002083 [Candelaria pacifica]|nr:MAG: hypothetical protein M1812_002083 [Candelaria pacifica]